MTSSYHLPKQGFINEFFTSNVNFHARPILQLSVTALCSDSQQLDRKIQECSYFEVIPWKLFYKNHFCLLLIIGTQYGSHIHMNKVHVILLKTHFHIAPWLRLFFRPCFVLFCLFVGIFAVLLLPMSYKLHHWHLRFNFGPFIIGEVFKFLGRKIAIFGK